MEVSEIHEKLVSEIAKFFNANHFKRAVVGVSGGLDSAVTLKLCVDALGAEKVCGLVMPENGLTKPENITHAQGLCDALGVESYKVSINAFMMDYSTIPWKQNDIAYINTKARIRANLLYNYANTFHALVVGTSNRSELMLGYGTKFGDLAADLLPLGSLYKTEIFELAEFMELPPEIVAKVPSAELYDGQTDEQELGGSYKEIDPILQQVDVGEEELVGKGMNSVLVRKVFQLMKANEHKLSTPPIISLL